MTAATPIPDYSGFQETSNEDGLAKLARLALEQHEAEQKLIAAQDALAAASDRLRAISEDQIPTLMTELGMETFTTKNGLKITVKEQLRHSISADKKAAAYAWINDNGGSDLIKRAFIIRFAKGDEKWAAKFQRDLAARKKPVDCERADDIHSATVKKFLLDKLADGVDVPLELFNAFQQRQSKVEITEAR